MKELKEKLEAYRGQIFPEEWNRIKSLLLKERKTYEGKGEDKKLKVADSLLYLVRTKIL